MTVDIVNDQNEKVGSLELDPGVFAGRVSTALIWESVVHQNASERRGSHATKTRGRVRGSGRKPWRQKGTGRARIGEVRSPLWRKGGTVFGPTPRSYAYALPRKMRRGALRAAFVQQIADGGLTVVDRLEIAETKTKLAVELLERLNALDGGLVIDVKPDQKLARSVSNLDGVQLRTVSEVTARDVLGAKRVVATSAAIQRLQEVLG